MPSAVVPEQSSPGDPPTLQFTAACRCALFCRSDFCSISCPGDRGEDVGDHPTAGRRHIHVRSRAPKRSVTPCCWQASMSRTVSRRLRVSLSSAQAITTFAEPSATALQETFETGPDLLTCSAGVVLHDDTGDRPASGILARARASASLAGKPRRRRRFDPKIFCV